MPTKERESLAQSPDLDARAEAKRRAVPALTNAMTEQQWELYRLSVVEEWHESPHKAAVIEAIKHKLMILALQEKASIEAPDALTSTAKPRNVTP
jgi:hypothetical protein